MDTCPWNCCRLCLSTQTLHAIFSIPAYNEKYTDVIFTITGLKVVQNDALPQEMCSTCITFINESVKFRKKCEITHKNLQNGSYKQFCDVNVPLKQENFSTAIDISDLIEYEVDFNDYDDNVTLDSLQNNYICGEKIETNGKTEIVFETSVKDIVDKRLEIIFNNKKRKLKDESDKPKRKVRKKENGKVDEKTVKERVKENIKCEYCQKILTSKLSLRNHYKIHTGFDVVCEHCGKKFITKRLLLMHCRAKHGYEKTDKCSYCDYKASNAEQVKIHERLHTGEKPYVCSECNAGFHRKSSYLQHVAIHLPEKTVQCDQCPARFKSLTLMRIHKNKHRAPQYSFKCRVCDNSFARRRNVARHLHRIHGLSALATHIERIKIG